MPQTQKLLIFDLDNTLIASDAAYKKAIDKTWPRQSKDFTMARDRVKKRLPAHHTSSHNRILYFKEVLDTQETFSPRELLSRYEKYEQTLLKEIRKNSKISRLRKTLQILKKKYQLAVITNENTRMQILKLNEIDPQGQFFSFVMTSEEMGLEKPSPRIFQECLRKMKKKASDTIMIGDRWEDDIAPALQLKFHHCYWVDSRISSKALKPSTRCTRISSIFELEGLL